MKKSFLKILKLVGISFASVIGFLGLSVGVFALFGGFNEKVVILEGMTFEQSAYVLDGNVHNENGIFDTTIKLTPTNEDATELDITLTGGNNIVNLPAGKDSQVGKNLSVKLQTITANDGTNFYTYNKGGEFTLKATQEETLLTTSTKVFVESKINSFVLTDNLNGALIYPGSKFKVSPSNILPTNSLNKPQDNVFYSVYGEDYFNKAFLYFSSNESVATVDMLTGEVEVLTEGDFYIFAYVPTTFKNNSILPNREECISDSEYFNLLRSEVNDLPLTVNNGINAEGTMSDNLYTSNPISVSGITATNNAFNLYVNESYKYSFSGDYAYSDKQLNLNINLLAPQNSNYTSEQLNYKLQDIEIFEGYKEDDKYYISAGQQYVDGVIQSQYLDIIQNKKPLYFEITPRDYTYSKDLYLIIRISNNKLISNEVTNITNNILCVNEELDTESNYVYYAFVKVNTKIVENTSLTLTTNKIMATFTQDTNGNLIYGSDGKFLNLADLIDSVLPQNATYDKRFVRFFVRNNGTTDNEIIVTQNSGSSYDEIPFIEIFDEEDNPINSGYFVKALREGTLQFYASIVKTDRNGENPVRLFNSDDITLIITQTINLSNFNVSLNPDQEGVYKLTKGNSLTITFETDNLEGLKKAYQEGFFKVTSSVNDKVAISIDIDNQAITIDALADGSTILNIEFNGIKIESENPLIPLNIQISNNDLQAINLTSAAGAINSQNQINFRVDGTKDELEYVINSTLANEMNPLLLDIATVGGSENIELNFYSTNNSNVSFEIDDRILKITPKTLCENVQFYIYSMVGGNMVRSSTYTINITADYTITANRKNEVTINTLNYEKVIGGLNYELLGENGMLLIKSSDDIDFSSKLFEITSSKIETNNIYSNGFISVDKNTECVITLKPIFSNEQYKYYFYVVPQYFVTSETVELNTGDTIAANKLSEKVKFIERTYDINNNYKIKENQISGDNTTLYKDETKTEKILDIYTAPANSFNNSEKTIYVTVQKGLKSYNGKINVVVKSNLRVENNNEYLNNNEEINLVDLFKIMNGTEEIDNEDLSDWNIVFNEDTFNKIILSGIQLLKNDNSKVQTYADSFTGSIVNNNLKTTIAKVKIPENFNTLYLTDLSCYISCNIEGVKTVKENHSFELNFQVSTLELVDTNIIDNTIYLISENKNENYIKSNFIKSATVVNKNTTSPENISSGLIINTADGNKVIFELNKIKKELNVELITVEQATDTYHIAGAYNITKLYTISPSVNVEGSIISVKLVDGTELLNNTHYCAIQNGHLIIKEAGNYKITFNVLGNIVEFDYEFTDINLTLTDNSNVYSNITYEIFDTADLPNSVNYEIKLLDKNNFTLTNNNIIIDNNNLKISAYTGNTLNFKLKITFNSIDNTDPVNTMIYEGATKILNVTLNSLFLTTNFTENFNGRQVLLNNANHNLGQYFTINTSDENLKVSGVVDLSKFSFSINGENVDHINDYEIAINENNFADNLMPIDLIVKINNLEIFKVPFSVEYVKLVTTFDATNSPYFIGQTLSRQDLLSLVKILGYNDNVITKYNNEILFNGSISNDYTITIAEGGTRVEVKLGENKLGTSGLNIVGGSINFPNNLTIQAYTDTKVFNYVSASYKGKVLNLEYSAANDNDYAVVRDNDKKLTYFKDGNTLIATLNNTTGEIVFENLTNAPTDEIIVTASVVGASTQSVNIVFDIDKVYAYPNEDVSVDIYVGDYTTDLRNYVYFGNKNNNNTAYEISELIYDQTLGNYSYHKNNLTDSYELLKNGSIVAEINGNNLITNSYLDNMSIKLNAYIKIPKSEGYELVSLRNNDKVFTVNFIKINVGLSESTINFDNEDYYLVDTSATTSYTLNPVITAGNEILSSGFKSLIYKEAFIGLVNNNSVSKQLNLTVETVNGSNKIYDKCYLPTKENIVITSASNKFSLTWGETPLSCYVFMKLVYTVGGYTNTLNIALKPDENNIITYKYDGEDKNYQSAVSPSEYILTSDTLFDFNNEDILDNDSALEFAYLGKEEPIITGDLSTYTYNQSPYYSSTAGTGSSVDFLHKLTFNRATNVISLIIETGNQTISGASYYAIRVNNNDNYYYYIIKIDNVSLTTENFIADEIDANQTNNNSEENRLNIISTGQMDLKDYIYINGISYKNSLIENPDYSKSLAFLTELNGQLSNDGILTPSEELIGEISVEFTFFGTQYSLYLQGESINFTFQNEGVNLSTSENYLLDNSKTYYIYLTKNEEILTFNLSEILTSSTELSGLVSLTNFNYVTGGQTYDDTSLLFENVVNGDTTTYKFGGLTLVSLVRTNSYYTLTLTDNIVGELSFDFNAKYSSLSDEKSASVSSEELIITYLEPSIVNNQQYQNMLSNSSLNLSNFVSGMSETNKTEVTYELSQTYSSVSLNNGVLTSSSDITNEALIEIIVTYNNIQEKLFVRVIPEYKYEFANNNKVFYVIKNEIINLNNFASAYRFERLDALNEPVYERLYNFTESDEEIENITSYVVDDDTNIKINNIEFTLNVVELDLTLTDTFYVGETINLYHHIQNIVKASSLTNKVITTTFNDDNNFVNEEGLFVADKAGEFVVNVTINNIDYEIQLSVSDLSISVNYTESTLINENNKPVKYQNIYATEQLVVNNFISVQSEDTQINNKVLQFSLEVNSANGYELNKFNSISMGETIYLYNDNVLLMSVNKDKIVCYNSVNFETLLQLKLSLKDNIYVENVFNIRLLPVTITLTDGIQYNIDNSYFNASSKMSLYNNFIVSNTTATQNNLNLNDKLKFYASYTNASDELTIDEINSDIQLSMFNNAKNNTLQITTILTDNSNINDKSVINESLALSQTFTIIHTNQANLQGTQILFQNNSTDKLLKEGSITSVSSYINDTNNTRSCYITSTKVEDGASFYFDVFNSIGENLIQISTNGHYTLKTTQQFSIVIEAFNLHQTIRQSIQFNTDDYNVDYSKITCCKEENGVKLIELLSNEELDLTDFLNGGVVSENLANVTYNSENKKLRANSVNAVTYGYFDVEFSSGQTVKRVYVKIYPYQITKLYEEDYSFPIANVEIGTESGSITAIEYGDKFKTLFVYNNTIFNLNDYAKFASDKKGTQNLTYSVDRVIAFNGSNYILVESSLAEEYYTLTDSNLTLKPNGTYYVTINANFGSFSDKLRFRVLQIQDALDTDENGETEITLDDNTIIDLNNLINIIAENNDNGYNTMPISKYNFFDKVDLTLSNNSGSYIKNGYLYVIENKTTQLTLTYKFSNLQGRVKINVTNNESSINYNLNGVDFVEFNYNASINLGDIDNIESVVVNNKTYNATVEIIDNVKYFVVNNIIKLNENGDVVFYDEQSSDYIGENKIGVIFVNAVVNTEYGYQAVNFKLNNYNITHSSGEYAYTENGEDQTSYLKFSIIGENGLMIDNSVVDENNVFVNGITLNTLTGHISGTKVDTTIKMYVKAYVQESNFVFGEKYKLFEI